MRIKHPKNVILGHLNINSMRYKHKFITEMINKNIDAMIFTETKLDNTFTTSQFYIEGYKIPYRRDRQFNGGGGILVYINDDISSRQLKDISHPTDIELLVIELNLKKKRWLLFACYHPPSQCSSYFLSEIGKVIDHYS